MGYPFPGMNPWLERPAFWRDVHHSLISALRDDLTPRLAPRYFVAVETHTYITQPGQLPPASRYPDVMILERGGPAVATAAAPSTAPFMLVELPLHEPLIEGYLEVRLVPTGEVITVIELLSYTNKLPGSGRDDYLEKRESLINSHVHFVEIDLLRAGPSLPYTEPAADSHYRLFIRRREVPRQARLYPFSVRQAIPTFPLPLLPDDQEPAVDLGALLQDLYDRARYDLVTDYAKPPEPPLNEADAAWAAERLTLQSE